MGFCRDKATTYLQARGYNVVRHPNELLEPLTLLGRQKAPQSNLGGSASS